MNTINDTKPTPRIPKFYDVIDMLNRPSTDELGLHRIVEDGRSWWPKLPDKRVIDLEAVRQHASKLDQNVPVCIDFEDLYDHNTNSVRPVKMDGRVWTAREIADDAYVARSLVRAYREGGFRGKIGFYGLLPIREVDWCILTRDPRYSDQQRLWKLACGMAALAKGLLDEIDFIAPSLYAIGPDVAQHLEWTGANIEQAKAYGKPVIAYISPESHWAATGGFARKLLSQPQWQGTLELIRKKHIDAVIWLGGDNTFKHDFAELPMWWECFEALRTHWNSIK